MNRPWMPLYVGDYLADTAHLRAAEHGAYLLLIMHYWRTGALPTDDEMLSRIARMTGREWKAARPVIEPLFQEGWKHKRIEFELTEAARLSAAGRTGGKASGEARRAKREANDQATENERSFNGSGNDRATKCEALQPHSPREERLDSFGGKKNGWSPPKHGAFHKQKGLVYIKKGTSEWTPHAADYAAVHFDEPKPDKGGGYWFKMKGEAAA